MIESLRPVAQRQNITLSLSGQHAVIQGVEQLLQEMVYNLCDNAIKYNVPGGNVAVSVWQNGPTTTLSVVDTGIGIPYADQSRVFERFYRVDKSHSKEGWRHWSWPLHCQARRTVPRREDRAQERSRQGHGDCRQLHRCKMTVNSDRAAASAAASFVHFPDPA